MHSSSPLPQSEGEYDQRQAHHPREGTDKRRQKWHVGTATTARIVPKSAERAPLPASSHPFSTSARSSIAVSILSTRVAMAHLAMT
jgi:hypothetical protein